MKIQRASLFKNGRSQAVRLPKEFRMPGTEVRIFREGNRVVLEPIIEGWSEELLQLIATPTEGIERPARAPRTPRVELP